MAELKAEKAFSTTKFASIYGSIGIEIDGNNRVSGNFLEAESSSACSSLSSLSCVSLTRLNSVITKPTRTDLNMMMKDRLFVDYFNVYLNLPIFPQRILYNMEDNQFKFDPPVLFGTESNHIPPQMLPGLGNWIIQKRYPSFLHSQLFLEYSICVDLLAPEPFDDTHKFTALSCNKFVYKTLGNVIGMRRFKADLQKTPGEDILKSLKLLDKFIGLPLTEPNRLAAYADLRRRVLATVSSDEKAVFFPSDEIYDEYGIDMNTLELLRHVLFFTLKVYWMPRFLIHCCAVGSKRRLRLEKEIQYCRQMVGKFLLDFPNLSKYKLTQICYDSVLPAKKTSAASNKYVNKHPDDSSIHSLEKAKGNKNSKSESLPGSELGEPTNTKFTSIASRRPTKKESISGDLKQSCENIVNKVFPTTDCKQLKTDQQLAAGFADICICVESDGVCSCNDELNKEKPAYKEKPIIPVGNTKCISSKESIQTTLPSSDHLTGKLSTAARQLFSQVDKFYSRFPSRQYSLLPEDSKKTVPTGSILKSQQSKDLNRNTSLYMSDAEPLKDSDTSLSNTHHSESSVHSGWLMGPNKYNWRYKSTTFSQKRGAPSLAHVASKVMKNIKWSKLGESIAKWTSKSLKSSLSGKKEKKKHKLHRKVFIVEKLRMAATGGSRVTRSEAVIYYKDKQFPPSSLRLSQSSRLSGRRMTRFSVPIHNTSIVESEEDVSLVHRTSAQQERSRALSFLKYSATSVSRSTVAHGSVFTRRRSTRRSTSRGSFGSGETRARAYSTTSSRFSAGHRESTTIDLDASKSMADSHAGTPDISPEQSSVGVLPRKKKSKGRKKKLESSDQFEKLLAEQEMLEKRRLAKSRKEAKEAKEARKFQSRNDQRLKSEEGRTHLVDSSQTTHEAPDSSHSPRVSADNLYIQPSKHSQQIAEDTPKVSKWQSSAVHKNVNIVFTLQKGIKKWQKIAHGAALVDPKASNSAHKVSLTSLEDISSSKSPKGSKGTQEDHLNSPPTSQRRKLSSIVKRLPRSNRGSLATAVNALTAPTATTKIMLRSSVSPANPYVQSSKEIQPKESPALKEEFPSTLSRYSFSRGKHSFFTIAGMLTRRAAAAKFVVKRGGVDPQLKHSSGLAKWRRLTAAATARRGGIGGRPHYSSKYFDTWASPLDQAPEQASEKPFNFVQIEGDDSAYLLSEEDRRRFADFHGKDISDQPEASKFKQQTTPTEVRKNTNKKSEDRDTNQMQERDSPKLPPQQAKSSLSRKSLKVATPGVTPSVQSVYNSKPAVKPNTPAPSVPVDKQPYRKDTSTVVRRKKKAPTHVQMSERLEEAKGNLYLLSAMKEQHPTDSLLVDIEIDRPVSKLSGYAERVFWAKYDNWKPLYPVYIPSTWKPKGGKVKLPDIYKRSSLQKDGLRADYHERVKHSQDAAYLADSKELAPCPVRPSTSSLMIDIKGCTNARQAAGDALPVVHGVCHITKVGYSVAPNLTIWNYVIQRYDTASPQAYRSNHYIYLLSMKSDAYAGSPFRTYLMERSKAQELSNYMFWCDAESFLSAASKGKVADHIRLRQAKELIWKYLLPRSPHRINTVSEEMNRLLIYSLQLDEADEVLMYVQDCAIESCRTLWKSYIKYDKVNFNNLLKLTDLHASVEAIKKSPHLTDSEQFLVSIVPQMEELRLPPIKPPSNHSLNSRCYQLLLSADRDALRMHGDNKSLDVYFNTASQGDKRTSRTRRSTALISSSEDGLISIDTLAMDAAFELSIHPDLRNTAGITKQKDETIKGSMQLMMERSFKSKCAKTLPDSVRKLLGLDRMKPVAELRIARDDIDDAPTFNPRSVLRRKSSAKGSFGSSKYKKNTMAPAVRNSRHAMQNRSRDDRHLGVHSSSDEGRRLGHKKPSKSPLPLYFDPILKNGRWIERPKKKPGSLTAVLNDDVYREFFMKFLDFCGAHWPLKLWIDCKEILQAKGKANKKKKLDALNKLHFLRNPSEKDEDLVKRQVQKYGLEDLIFQSMVRAEKVELPQVQLLADLLFTSLDKHWFKYFQDTFDEEAEEILYNRKEALVFTWRRLSWVIIDFYRSIKNSQLRQRFLKFVKQDNDRFIFLQGSNVAMSQSHTVMPAPSKLLVTPTPNEPAVSNMHGVVGGLAPMNLKKPSMSAGRNSRVSMITSGASSAVNKERAKTPVERDRNKFCNDVYFLLEASRYYRVVRNVRANERGGLRPREDFIYAKAKCRAIVERFFDSDVAPRNQINVTQAMAEQINRSHKVIQADTRLFFECEMSVLFPTLTLWKRFLKSYWIECSYKEVIHQPEPTPVIIPFHDTVKYEYVMVNASGEHEVARMLTSVEGGIRQYVFLPRVPLTHKRSSVHTPHNVTVPRHPAQSNVPSQSRSTLESFGTKI